MATLNEHRSKEKFKSCPSYTRYCTNNPTKRPPPTQCRKKTVKKEANEGKKGYFSLEIQKRLFHVMTSLFVSLYNTKPFRLFLQLLQPLPHPSFFVQNHLLVTISQCKLKYNLFSQFEMLGFTTAAFLCLYLAFL